MLVARAPDQLEGIDDDGVGVIPHESLQLFRFRQAASVAKWTGRRPRSETADFEILRVLYREIGKLLEDPEPMELLSESLYSCFQITDPAHSFLQGTVDGFLFSLTWRDEETSRQVFQLLLDREEEEPF